MRCAMALVVLLGSMLGVARPGDAWPDERAATHTFTCAETRVAMRDGVKLATDVYLPQGTGPFPVLVERTPYDKGDCKFRFAPYLAERGYVVIVQDVRGRFRSDGEFYNYVNEGWGERRDGYDTIEWAAVQPWSNGRVGTMGLSYTCFNQNITAVTQPAHLKAMFCADSASNWYKDYAYPGGVLRGNNADWELRRFQYRGTMQEWTRWYRRRVDQGLDFWAGWQTPRFFDVLHHPLYDDHWRSLAPDEHLDKFVVPVYYTTGWYDEFTRGVIRMFNGVRESGGSALARDSVKLLIGPWLHAQGRSGDTTVTGDVDFGSESKVHFGALMVRWFDYHLRGVANGVMDEPRVRIFVMGVNRMRDEREFPPARAVPTKFYLQSGPAGSIDSLNDGRLARQPAAGNDKPDAFQYDPRDPVPSIGDNGFTELRGAQDHRPADRRSLTFTTTPFGEDLEITGSPVVELYVSSSADDTDFVATVSDVRRDGYAQVLRQDVVRASRRESLEKPTSIEPGRVYKLTISMPAISNVFLKGHRLRLTVTSSSFPRYIPIRNKFMVNNEDAPFVTATNTVYHDAQRPSALIVPVMPSGAAPTARIDVVPRGVAGP